MWGGLGRIGGWWVDAFAVGACERVCGALSVSYAVHICSPLPRGLKSRDEVGTLRLKAKSLSSSHGSPLRQWMATAGMVTG